MKKAATFLILLFTTFATPTLAQEPTRVNELRLTTGFTAWLDEVMDYSASTGVAYRRYLTPQVGIETEFLYMKGAGSIRDFTLIPHITYDFRPDRRVRPYLIAGVGWKHHREKFPGALFPDFQHNEATVSGGIGVKVFATRRVFFAPEVRMGFEPIFRVTGSFGFVF
jgi:hypothetical protein